MVVIAAAAGGATSAVLLTSPTGKVVANSSSPPSAAGSVAGPGAGAGTVTPGGTSPQSAAGLLLDTGVEQSSSTPLGSVIAAVAAGARPATVAGTAGTLHAGGAPSGATGPTPLSVGVGLPQQIALLGILGSDPAGLLGSATSTVTSVAGRLPVAGPLLHTVTASPGAPRAAACLPLLGCLGR
jgi:hypothetical protein